MHALAPRSAPRSLAFTLCFSLWTMLTLAAEPLEVSYFPPQTVVYVEIPEPAALAATLRDHPLREKIEALPAYEQVKQTPPYLRAKMGLAFVEGSFGMPWAETLERFAGRGIQIGLDPQNRGLVALIRGRDADAMQELEDRLIALPRPGDRALTQGEYRGQTVYDHGNFKWLVYEDRLLVTNQAATGRACIDRLIDNDGSSLADQPAFQTAVAQRDPAATAWGFVDAARARESFPQDAPFERPLPNPLAELFFGGLQNVAGKTPALTAELTLQPEHFGLQFATPFDAAWIPEHRDYFWGPEGRGQAPAVPQLPETLLTLGAYRDVSQMWLWAGDLFNEQTNDAIAQADANLTTLFAGRDFGEDILGAVEPELGIVVTRQDFAELLPRPALKLPAFALTAQLRDPATMRSELRRIFQSLVGFLNIVGAMEGRHQLELGRETLAGDGELLSATFVPEVGEATSQQANLVFNFSPSLAFAEDRLVLASTQSLARQLLAADPVEPATKSDNTIADNTAIALQADVLRKVLEDNREQLIAQNMLAEGHGREEAAAIIDLLLTAIGYFEQAALALGLDQDRLTLDLNLRFAP